MFEKILIANRGEIALRILRACRELGIKTVIVYSEADRDARYVKLADEKICIGPAASSSSYLNIPAIISACEITKAQAIHPGFGFLSENANFARCVEDSGFIFIGPRHTTMEIMGNKISAKKAMIEAGIPVVSGSVNNIKNDDEALEVAKKIGYPLLLKAAAGGGGRGMRVVYNDEDMLLNLAITKQEALNYFKDDSVYAEQYLANPRHIEIQVLADEYGNVIHLGDRDCSMQRRHQKVIEEAMALDIPIAKKDKIYEACINACKLIKYRGAGTLEFLYENDNFYFIEMNTRVQVEHTITEMVTGIDIIKEQIYIASGEKLRYKQEDIKFNGHAIQCRINAEDPFSFIPSPGKIISVKFPGGNGVRVDSHIENDYVVPPYYDSMIAKIIVHSENRRLAIKKMLEALSETKIDGIKTNIPLHIKLLSNIDFMRNPQSIHFLENLLDKDKPLSSSQDD
jgi:acetyl-CoA carboxylase biotin carboxylase subunit